MVEGEKKSGQCIVATDEGAFDEFLREVSRRGPLDVTLSVVLAVRNGLPEVIKLLYARVAGSRNN